MGRYVGFNAKDFSHVSSDKEKTILRHKMGHEVTIAHKSLSKDMRTQLEAMIPQESNESQAMAQGGEVKPEKKIGEKIGEFIGQYGVKPVIQAVQDTAQGLSTIASTVGDVTSDVGSGVMNVVAPKDPNAPTPDPQAIQTAATENQVQLAQAQAPQESAEPAPAPTIAPTTDAMTADGLMEKGLGASIAGIQGIAQAQADLGKQQSAILETAQKERQEAMDSYKSQFDQLSNERLALLDDINSNQISPDKFWTGDPKTGMGGHSKLAAAIGIIIAGFNPTNRPNAAIEFLQHQMDQNLQAQKENLGKQKSLLEANLRQFGNIKDAMDMTRVMQTDIVANQLQQAAAQSASPLAKAAAQQAIGKLQMDAAPIFQKLAANRTMAQLTAAAQQDPSKIPAAIAAIEAVDPDKAKAMRERYVPGVGLANSPEDKKHLVEVEDRRKNIQRNSQEVIKMIKAKGTYEMLGPHNEILNGLVDQIATDMAKLQDPASIARPSEVELVKQTLVQASKTTQDKTAIAQVKKFYETVDQRAAEAYRTRGMTPPKSLGLGPEFMTRNGIQYQKVEGGWKKVQ